MTRIREVKRTGSGSFSMKVDYDRSMTIEKSLRAIAHPPIEELRKAAAKTRNSGNRAKGKSG